MTGMRCLCCHQAPSACSCDDDRPPCDSCFSCAAHCLCSPATPTSSKASVSTPAPPAGFRLSAWEHPAGVARFGLVCNRCGGVANPVDPAFADQAAIDAGAARHVCPPPLFEWDRWRLRAADRGVDPELADLGRSLYREARQHAWTHIGIDPEQMLRDALHAPGQARQRWKRLLAAGP